MLKSRAAQVVLCCSLLACAGAEGGSDVRAASAEGANENGHERGHLDAGEHTRHRNDGGDGQSGDMKPRVADADHDAAVPDGRSRSAGDAGTHPTANAQAGTDAAMERAALDDAGKLDAREPQQSVTVRFRAVIGDADFECGQTYADQGATNVLVTPQDFRFYVYDMRLINTDGDEAVVAFDDRAPHQSEKVVVLDFEDDQGACAPFGDPDTNTVITGTVPAGEYAGVVFRIGVPEALNHADPTTLPAPLQANGMTWGWLLGYKFLVAQLAHAPDGGTAPGLGLVHLGSTGCEGNPATGITCINRNRNQVRLADFDPARDEIVADLGAVFARIDLTADMQCHSSGNGCGPMFEALGVDFKDGAALDEQDVFRAKVRR